MTNREAIAMVMELEAVKANSELLEKLGKIEASFTKKSATGEKKPTKAQVENEAIKAELVENLRVTGKVTVSELQKAVPSMGDLSNQKLTALLRQLVEAGTVTKVVESRKSYFVVA